MLPEKMSEQGFCHVTYPATATATTTTKAPCGVYWFLEATQKRGDYESNNDSLLLGPEEKNNAVA